MHPTLRMLIASAVIFYYLGRFLYNGATTSVEDMQAAALRVLGKTPDLNKGQMAGLALDTLARIMAACAVLYWAVYGLTEG